jgi:hypothetical protein
MDQNSKRSRVEPVFGWLKNHGGADWATAFLRLADGIAVSGNVGLVVNAYFEDEKTVPPSAARLAWMIRNAHRLTPRDGRLWAEYARRVINNPQRDGTLRRLDTGDCTGVPQDLRLETSTHCDCLIECEHAYVWIEGKRNDWLDVCTKWDVFRDQLARNVEALWSLAQRDGKDYWLVICHEYALKHHEQCLVDGYRAGTWYGGWPHLTSEVRTEFRHKIATLTWTRIADNWPGLRTLPSLQDLV